MIIPFVFIHKAGKLPRHWTQKTQLTNRHNRLENPEAFLSIARIFSPVLPCPNAEEKVPHDTKLQITDQSFTFLELIDIVKTRREKRPRYRHTSQRPS